MQILIDSFCRSWSFICPRHSRGLVFRSWSPFRSRRRQATPPWPQPMALRGKPTWVQGGNHSLHGSCDSIRVQVAAHHCSFPRPIRWPFPQRLPQANDLFKTFEVHCWRVSGGGGEVCSRGAHWLWVPDFIKDWWGAGAADIYQRKLDGCPAKGLCIHSQFRRYAGKVR